MRYILIFVIFSLLFASAYADESIPMVQEDIELVAASIKVQVDVEGSWKFFIDNFGDRKFTLLPEDPVWYKLDNKSGLITAFTWTLDPDNEGQRKLKISYLDQEFTVTVIGTGDSGSSNIFMKDVAGTNCFSNTKEDGSRDIDFSLFENKVIEGDVCGVKLEASSGFGSKISIHNIRLKKEKVHETIERLYTPTNRQRNLTTTEVAPIVTSLLDKIVVEAHETGGYTPYTFDLIRSNRFVDSGYEAEMKTTDLSFDVDDPGKAYMEIFAAKRQVNYVVFMESPEDPKVKFRVVRYDKPNRARGEEPACDEADTFTLERIANKFTRNLCGLSLGANWETLATETDVDIEHIWIEESIITTGVTRAVKGRDVVASTIFSSEVAELSSVIKTLEIFDFDNFQVIEDSVLYIGAPVGLTEPDYFSNEKNKYAVLTSEGVIKYAFYTPSDWVQNQLHVKKPLQNTPATRIDSFDSIQAFEQFFENSMGRLEPQEISQNEIENIVTFGDLTPAEAQAAYDAIDRKPDEYFDEEEILIADAIIVGAGALAGVATTGAAATEGGAAAFTTTKVIVTITATGETITTTAKEAVVLVNRAEAVARLETQRKNLLKMKGVFESILKNNPKSALATRARDAINAALPQISKSLTRVKRAKTLRTMLKAIEASNVYVSAAVDESVRATVWPSWSAKNKALLKKISSKSFLDGTRNPRLKPAATTKTITKTHKTRKVIHVLKRGGLLLWRGGKGARLALLPTGPVGWGVLLALGAVDTAMIAHDYTKVNTYVYDDGKLIVGWDKELWSTNEVRIDYIYYRKDAGEIGDVYNVFTFLDSQRESLKSQDLIDNSIGELLDKGILKIYPVVPKGEADVTVEAGDVIKLEGLTLETEAEPAVTVDVEFVKKPAIKVTAELYGDHEILVGHNAKPGLYVVAWEFADNEPFYELLIIGGIDDGTGSAADIDGDGAPDANIRFYYMGSI